APNATAKRNVMYPQRVMTTTATLTLNIAVVSLWGPAIRLSSTQAPADEHQEHDEDGPQKEEVPEGPLNPVDGRARQGAKDDEETTHEDLELFLAQEPNDGIH